MFKNPSFIFDIVCTAVWLLLLWRYARKGFFASVVQLVGNLACLVGAQRLAVFAANWVFENLLAARLSTQLAQSLAGGGAVDLAAIAEQYAGFLPESVRQNVLEACRQNVAAALNDTAALLAQTIVQNLLRPLLVPVLMLVVFFVAYALLRMLVSLLGTVLGLVNHLPVLGTVNRWLGLAVGGLASLVDIYLALCVVWAVIVVTGGSLTVLNDTVMRSSVYYKLFNLFNPFL